MGRAGHSGEDPAPLRGGSLRANTDRQRINTFLAALGRRVRGRHVVYLAGGASAVLIGWRPSTIDIDLRPEPDSDELLRAVSELKRSLDVNVETASPLEFIPELPGWRDRSRYVNTVGAIEVRHMDFRLQALAKLERGSTQDLADVAQMIAHGLVSGEEIAAAFELIRPRLFRFPAVDEDLFARNVAAYTQPGDEPNPAGEPVPE
ncbi:MAG: DUF6036 family nucleotidyltransferase [Solirubrobacteraceae bacterium]